MLSIHIQKIEAQDQPFISEIMRQYWGADLIVVHGDIYRSSNMGGLKAVKEDEIVGFLHYEINAGECEILTLISLDQGQGVATKLITAVEQVAIGQNCQQMSVITTNDNLHALGFYQRQGYRLAALYPRQVEVSRTIKPSIPALGENKIPIRDEIRLEKDLPTRSQPIS